MSPTWVPAGISLSPDGMTIDSNLTLTGTLNLPAGIIGNDALTDPVTGPVACGRGCAHCCTTFVSATVPEILHLANSVRNTMPRAARVMTLASCPAAMITSMPAWRDDPATERPMLAMAKYSKN